MIKAYSIIGGGNSPFAVRGERYPMRRTQRIAKHTAALLLCVVVLLPYMAVLTYAKPLNGFTAADTKSLLPFPQATAGYENLTGIVIGYNETTDEFRMFRINQAERIIMNADGSLQSSGERLRSDPPAT